MIPKPTKRKLNPFSIALTYTLLGGFWIFFSEPALRHLFSDPGTLKKVTLINHWVFIVVSAQILFLLIRRHEIEIDRYQDSLHRVIRALMVFRGCHKVITHDCVEQDILMEVCRTLVKVGGYRMAWVGFAQDDQRKSIKPVAYWGNENGYLDTVKATWDDTESGQGPAGTTIRTGLTTVVQNIPTDPRFRLWRQQAVEHGYQSATALPLRSGRDTFGALVIMAEDADAFNTEEISLLEELAEDLSFGIKTVRGESEREKGQKELAVLGAVVEQASEGVLIFDDRGICLYGNPAVENICEVKTTRMVGQPIRALACYQRNLDFYQAVEDTIRTGEVHSGTYINHKEDGRPYQIQAKIAPVVGLDGNGSSFVASIHDITQQLQLEEQLRTAQKMEAVATLSGGIAHDFNNILAAIITNTEMSLEDVEDDDVRENLEIVLKAGLRGRNLVKQIKTLGQHAPHERKPVHLETIITECLGLLRASLPTSIEIKKHIVPGLPKVPADATQIHQVLLNLCTNAADAIRKQSGVLEVRLEAVEILADFKSGTGLHPGHYQKLTIRDSGQGMPPEILERIFDPFFTTKELGKGTGLGLSVVHSIVKSHDGSISVNSSPSAGTTFEIYLPQIYCVEVPLPENNDSLLLPGRNEHILLVDDEVDIAQGGKKMLERLGYRVTAETDPRLALDRFTAAPEQFDLLITDQTMPHMTGEMLALEILSLRNNLPIILCSGLGSSPQMAGTVERVKSLGVKALLSKPFERKEIAEVVRTLLDQSLPTMDSLCPES
ncbi:MAG TPA: ATP-binding protein [Desulfuromonadales bacterium]|nr:ATP-binding protein [Desulfuromonadales bacterium]